MGDEDLVEHLKSIVRHVSPHHCCFCTISETIMVGISVANDALKNIVMEPTLDLVNTVNSMTVASLKEKIIAQWPRENAPKMINEIKLINGGKRLENNTTVSEVRSLPVCELPGIVPTKHVVLRPPIFDPKKEKLQDDSPITNRCVCCIL